METVRQGYRCMPRARIEAGCFGVRAVAPAEIESIRRWRNAQLDVLRQGAPISPEAQVVYYERHVWPEMARERPGNILLTFEEHGVAIGYGGLVHIAWEHLRAEVSFLLDHALVRDDALYRRSFRTFLGLVGSLAFDDLGFGRIWTESYAIRGRHMAVLEEAGFRREGVLRNHVRIDGRPVDSIIHGCLRPGGSAGP